MAHRTIAWFLSLNHGRLENRLEVWRFGLSYYFMFLKIIILFYVIVLSDYMCRLEMESVCLPVVPTNRLIPINSKYESE